MEQKSHTAVAQSDLRISSLMKHVLDQWFSTFLHQRTAKKRKNFLRTGSIQSQECNRLS